MTNTQQQRHIRFDGALNFRDIGGYPTGNGGTVRWDAVYRSAALHDMTERDARKASTELGVRTVLDLRGPAEFERAPAFGPLVDSGQVTRHHVRIGNDAVAERLTAARAEGAFSLGRLYVWWAELAGSEIAGAFSALAESIDSPVVFHCSVGKDRTGVMAALLLDALGVDDETIVADYALTSSSIADIIEWARRDGVLTAENEAQVMPALAVDSEAIRGLLAHLRSEFGGAGEYLKAQGLAPSAMQRIRERLIVARP